MKLMDKIDRVFAVIGMICLFLIMVIVSVDGIGRQFFNKPIIGAYMLVENYLMVAMVFPVIGYTWSHKGHISVTILYDKMPKLVQNIAYLLTILFGLTMFGIIGYISYNTTLGAMTKHLTTSGLVRWPLWLAYIWLPIGSFTFCVRLIIEFVVCLDSIRVKGINRVVLNTGTPSHASAD